MRLNFYTVEELEQVGRRAARLLSAPTTAEGEHEIARRSRGTPRIADRLLRRVRDFAHAVGAEQINSDVHRVTQDVTEKLVGAECGYHLSNVLT